MKKRILPVILLFVASLVLAACKAKTTPTESAEISTQPTTATTEQAALEQTP